MLFFTEEIIVFDWFAYSASLAIMEHIQKTACEQYLRRKQYSSKLKKIDNSGLHAGSPMYYYCKHCGTPTEVLPEEHLFPPSSECSQCMHLIRKDWMSIASQFEG